MRKAIEETVDGCVIHLTVKFGPHSRFPFGYDTWRKRIIIQLNKEPIKGQANNEILRQIALYFNLTENEVKIVYGLRSREKGVFLKASVATVEQNLNYGL